MSTLGTGAGTFDIQFQIGSYREIYFDFDTDISLWTFSFELREYEGGKILFSLSLGSGLSFPVYETDQLKAVFSAVNTAREDKEYYWQLRRADLNIPLLNGKAPFSYDAPPGDAEPLTTSILNQTVSVTITGGLTSDAATQAEVNTGTVTDEYVSPSTLQKKDDDVVALVDASSMALTGPKHTLASSSATRTFTISHLGDEIVVEVTLSATSATYTFPVTALCVSEGVASGNNTLGLAGVSGDKYVIGIIKIGSAYHVACKNFGQ